jgi:2-C-methyl-D-erythritol 4-phosphate cytidylyltransferase
MMPYRKSAGGAHSGSEPAQECWAIILAGGSGERLGMDAPKGFVPLAGRPLLAWSLLAFARHGEVTDIQVVVPDGWLGEFHRAILRPLEPELGDLASKIHMPVVGGRRRQDSAQAGLSAALSKTSGKQPEKIPVLIHDAARPIVRPEVITDLLSSLRSAHQKELGVAGVVPALAADDTLKVIMEPDYLAGEVPRGRVVRTLPRERMWFVQTPQAFCLGPLLEAHREAVRADYRVNDDAMLFEWMGWPVESVPGTPLSMKVTHAEDLSLLEGWLSVRSATSLPPRRMVRRDRLKRRARAGAPRAPRSKAGKTVAKRRPRGG